MAHYKRRRPRTTSVHGRHDNRWKYDPRRPDWRWMGNWPRWHDIVFHTRPHRRRTREAIVQVMQGHDPDAIIWPVEKKPHIYYW